MFELEKTEEIRSLISITKSDSGVSGRRLAQAHMRLGELLAENMPFDPKDTTVVAILESGMCFALGIYLKLDCRLELYNPKHEKFKKPDTGTIILADSVIHTGRTVKEILTPDMYLASCVTYAGAVKELGKNLYTVRVSQNSFVGSAVKKQEGNRGPDTTMRLFNQL